MSLLKGFVLGYLSLLELQNIRSDSMFEVIGNKSVVLSIRIVMDIWSIS
jgi:hypothetical protein